MNIDSHSENCRKLRNACKPLSPIEFLVIGESPPMSGEYFYKPTDLKKGSKRIPAQIFRAMFKVDGVDIDTYKEYLIKLQNHYLFYLDDLSEFPLNGFDTKTRMEMIKRSLENFISRINSLQLSANCKTTLVLPHKTLSALIQNNKELFHKITEVLNITPDGICTFSQLETFVSRNWTILK